MLLVTLLRLVLTFRVLPVLNLDVSSPSSEKFFYPVYAFNKIDRKNYDESARDQQKKSYSEKIFSKLSLWLATGSAENKNNRFKSNGMVSDKA